MMSKQFIDAVLYQIGDKVIAMNPVNGVEAKLTGLDYSKILTVKAVIEKESEDYKFLLLQFEGSDSWHAGINYLPADKATRDAVINDCRDVFRQRRTSSSTTKAVVKKEDEKKVVVTKSIFKK